jgi:hypothetical protein
MRIRPMVATGDLNPAQPLFQANSSAAVTNIDRVEKAP